MLRGAPNGERWNVGSLAPHRRFFLQVPWDFGLNPPSQLHNVFGSGSQVWKKMLIKIGAKKISSKHSTFLFLWYGTVKIIKDMEIKNQIPPSSFSPRALPPIFFTGASVPRSRMLWDLAFPFCFSIVTKNLSLNP